MTTSKKKGKKPQVEYGEPRPLGMAGPEAEYILKSVGRWRLRGDGTLSAKK